MEPGNHLQAICTLPAGACGALEERLFALGAVSVTLCSGDGEAILEPSVGEMPLWQRVRLEALFAADEEPATLMQRLTGDPELAVAESWQVEPVEQRCWERVWMDLFQPMRFGRHLWICPSHHRVEEAGATVLRLDPGLAFGTGTHPTTRLCLEWLAGLELTDTTVLDYGCGSGVLAIAARLLGARSVEAVDNDPQALLAVAGNARDNGITTGLTVAPPESAGREVVDIVVANILANTLVDLAPVLLSRLRPGSRLALSGILSQQAEMVRLAYADACPLRVEAEQEGWALLVGERTRV